MGLDRSSWGHISKWEWLVRINVFHFLLNAILKTKALLFVCFFLLFLQPECTNLGQLERYCTNWVALVSAKSLLKVWTIWRLNRDLKLISSKKPFSLKRATAPPKFWVANLDYLLPLLEIAIIWQLPQHLDVSWMFPAMAGLGAPSSAPGSCCSSAPPCFSFSARGYMRGYKLCHFCEGVRVPQQGALDAGSTLVSPCVYNVQSLPAVSTNLIKALFLWVGDL